MKFMIPNEPTDGFTLEYWDADIDSHRLSTANPRGFRATYYVNTPWENHPWSNTELGGSPFVDQWAIETITGAAQGRRQGWAETARLLNADEDIFPTRAAAMLHIRRRIAQRIVLLGQERDALRQRLREIDHAATEVKP